MLPRRSIYFFFDGSFISLFNFFHNQKHQDFVSIIESIQDDKYSLIRGDGIHQKVHPFPFVYHNRSFLVNKKKIRQNVKFIYIVFYIGNFCVVRRKIICFWFIDGMNYQYNVIGNTTKPLIFVFKNNKPFIEIVIHQMRLTY